MKVQNKITKEEIIRSIAKKANIGAHDVKCVYNELENFIFDALCSVNEEQDICIKLFEGVSLGGRYVPQKNKQNNLTGKVSLVSEKIKPKFNITRSYCEKLNKK